MAFFFVVFLFVVQHIIYSLVTDLRGVLVGFVSSSFQKKKKKYYEYEE